MQLFGNIEILVAVMQGSLVCVGTRLQTAIVVTSLAIVPWSNAAQAANDAPHEAHHATPSQQAVLYVEDPSTQGDSYYGLTSWRTETIPSADINVGSQAAVLAQIDFPKPRMLARWTLRPNTDRALAASHVIEISFELPPDFPGGGIHNVPGIVMKVSRTAPGTPLIGLTEKVKSSSFLFALSSADAEMQRNLQLLKDRNLVDVALVLNNGQRAILSLQKGPSGQRAFAEALAAWKQ